jgi:hypothetical protein
MSDLAPLQPLAQSLQTIVAQLSETIGPRGSATEDEEKASNFVAEKITDFGLTPQRQSFLSVNSAYAPYALTMVLALLALFLFWQSNVALAIAAIFLVALALGSVWLELQFKSNFLRWVLPKDHSQNIIAHIPQAASASPQPPIVITAHVDTHRTPLVFSSPTWLRFFRLMLPLGIGALVALLLLFLIGLLAGFEPWRYVALAPGAVALALVILLLQADRSPHTAGANDNASGVAVALELAARLAQSPLKQRDVFVVLTGCEEVACYGADAFFAERRTILRNAIHFVIDQVGGKDTNPAFVVGEQFLKAAPSDAGLIKMAAAVSASHPELNAHTRNLNTGYSELSVGVLHGLRTIGLGSFTAAGESPHWHQPTDTLANVDAAVIARSTELAWHFLQALDAHSDERPRR